FPPVKERYALLEDALELLPLMWGKGTPPFEGRTTTVSEAFCYPRPLQEKVPIMIGGSGERKTLKLVAQYADACNLFGDRPPVRHKIDVLHSHCAALGRDPAEITITHLSPAPVDVAPSDHVGRYRELAEVGVHTAIVQMPGLDDPAAVERFAEVIAAFA